MNAKGQEKKDVAPKEEVIGSPKSPIQFEDNEEMSEGPCELMDLVIVLENRKRPP